MILTMAEKLNGMRPAAMFLLVVPFLTLLEAQNTIPQDRSLVSGWFKTNVGSASKRKDTLDPELYAAESNKTFVTVSKDGTGDFKSLTDAIKSVPSGNRNRIIISIGPGVYQEKVTIPRDKPFITLKGQGSSLPPTMVFGGTAAEYGTVYSATVSVESDYFVATNMVFKNSAPLPSGKPNQQGLALKVVGDKAAFYHCRFIGYQDTLHDDAGKHFFKDCYIEGTVDFIFGRGKSIYLACDLYVLDSGGYTMVTAHSRVSDTEDTGYSFVHCNIEGTAQNSVLGRAWMPAPRVVFSFTQMGSVINPEGWSDNSLKARQKTVFYGEFENTGPGAERSKRVPYSKELSVAEVKPFLTLDYIDGSKWLLPPP